MKPDRKRQVVVRVGHAIAEAGTVLAADAGAPQSTMTADTPPAAVAQAVGSPAIVEPPVQPEARARMPGQTDADMLPPSLRERYEDIEFLGEGGMGTVYRGRDKRLHRLAALKLLRRADPVLALRLLQEARAQARVQHDLVCRVYEAGEADGEPFIAMQYIDGEPLSQAKHRMTLEQKVKVVREVSAALHEAHRLGLVHRDIKPGNILVETGEDGAFKPYVVDFGLAREVAQQGPTMTGALLGTPAFMAPEQARGEIRSLDRRTDVYSLGATLYDLLAGRPPFVAEQSWKVLAMVADEEAPRLRSVMKQVPADLETIVMKCLRREPAERYESARALGEDLQRFLDGDAIQARRSALSYVLWRKAKKHKWAVLIVGTAIVGAAVPAGAWVNARRDAAEQVAFARALGEDIKEMELFLRGAYTLPLHDVEQERDVVRARLGEIERRMAAAGGAGEGPGHYAIGRGYLALGDPQKAREHLEKAQASGYRSVDLDYALGRALGELYRTALDETKRIQNKQEREAKVREIETGLRDPALVHLGAARGAAIESPAYAEGLIAFYGGKYEEALAKAKEAFVKAPWFYEAKKLEGDAQFAQGSQFGLYGHFDWGRMMARFDPAAEAYRVAADAARSDPDVHRAECELWTAISDAAGAKAELKKQSFRKADEACTRSIGASSGEKRARVLRASNYATLASSLSAKFAGDDDPGKFVEDAVRMADEVVRLWSEDNVAQSVLNRALRASASYSVFSGRDGRASVRRAVDAGMEAVRIEPWLSQAQLSLALARLYELIFDSWWGRDVTPAMERALQAAGRVIAADPDYALGWTVKGCVYYFMFPVLIERGQSPEEQVRRTLVAAEEAARLSPDWWGAYQLKSEAHFIMAIHEIHASSDPRGSLQKAMQSVQELKQRNNGPIYNEVAGKVRYAQALYMLQSGDNPQAMLHEAREAFQRAAHACPWALDTAVWRARVEVLAIRWAIERRKAQPAVFEAALAPLRPFLSEERFDPSFYQVLTEIHALRAEWLLERGQSPAGDIAEGLAMAGKALAINPRLATALAAKARVHLVEARAARARPARAEAALRAREAFQAAFQNNPLLEREHGHALRLAGGFH